MDIKFESPQLTNDFLEADVHHGPTDLGRGVGVRAGAGLGSPICASQALEATGTLLGNKRSTTQHRNYQVIFSLTEGQGKDQERGCQEFHVVTIFGGECCS